MFGKTEPLDALILKVERAKKHILDLQDAGNKFLEGNPYEISNKDDPQTGERVYYLSKCNTIPDEHSVIIGDVVHNLRSALDHLAHHLVVAGAGNPGPFPHVYFPICKNAADYKATSGRKMHGMRQNAINAIDRVEPYGRGAGEILWHLQCLNNIDKHRLLITVYGNLQGHSSLPSQRNNSPCPNSFIHSWTFVPPKIKRFPLKAGDELARVAKEEIQENMQFALSIAFGEPESIKGEMTVPLLLRIHQLVLAIIFRFDREGLLN